METNLSIAQLQEQLKEAKAKAKAEEREAKAKAKAEEKEAKAQAKAEEKEAKAQEKAQEKAKFEAAVLANPMPNIDNWFCNKTFLAPEFTRAKFSKADRKAFKRIKYAFNPADHSVMILVKTAECDWAALPLDSKTPTELARVCAMAKPDDEATYTNLADELEAKTTGMLDTIFSHYGSTTKDVNQDKLVEALMLKVPNTMLKVYNIGVLASQETYKPDPANETEKKFSRPHSAWFYKGELSSIKDVYDLLCEHAPLFLKQPSMCVPMPKLFSNDPNETALHHIDIESLMDYEGKHPTWDFYFCRFDPSEAKVIRAFIFSIIYAKNNSRQVLYILDLDGFSGKSVLLNVLTSILGAKYVQAVQKDSLNNQFSMAKVWDKILVIISDNKNPQLLRSEKLHMMTGGDNADIEKKGRDSFIARLQMKIIASGNTKLEIDPDADHERTRLIVVRPKMNDTILKQIALLDDNGNIVRNKRGKPQLIGDPTFEAKLLAEFGSMLVQARKDYQELCPNDGNIILPELIEDEIDNCSPDHLDIVDEQLHDCVTFDAEGMMSPAEMQELYDSYILTEFDEVKKRFSYEDFITHLSKRYKIRKRTVRMPDGSFPKRYIGISMKSNKDGGF